MRGGLTWRWNIISVCILILTILPLHSRHSPVLLYNTQATCVYQCCGDYCLEVVNYHYNQTTVYLCCITHLGIITWIFQEQIIITITIIAPC